MGEYQDIHVGKEHLESPAPWPESSLVFLQVHRPRPVEVYSRSSLNATHSDQLKWRRGLLRFATLQRVVQCP